jgi:hypothetical protein
MNLHAAEGKLEELYLMFEGSEQNDVAILKSLPGIGRINLATLLAEASGPLSRRDYPALRTLTGVAPVYPRRATRPPSLDLNASSDCVQIWTRQACEAILTS